MESSSSPGQHLFFGAGIECQETFQQWWSIARKSEEPPSPYDFLTHMGLPDNFVKNTLLLEMMKHSYRCKPRHSSRKGYVDYMAYHCSKGTKRRLRKYHEEKKTDTLLEDLLCGNSYSSKPLIPQQDYPTERDILALADATNPENWNQVIKLALKRNFSTNFLHSLVSKVPKDALQELPLRGKDFRLWGGGPPGMRRAFDVECVSAVNMLLPALKSFSLSPNLWTVQAMTGLLNSILQSKSLEKVELGFSSLIWDDTEAMNERSISTLPLTNIFDASSDSCCGIKELSLQLNIPLGLMIGTELEFDEMIHVHPTTFLDCLVYMPQLRSLDLDILRSLDLDIAYESGDSLPFHSQLAAISPYILKAMKTLQHLSICAFTFDTPDGTAKSALVSILEALQDNTSLESLTFVEGFDPGDFDHHWTDVETLPWDLFEDKLLKIFEKGCNTTLGILNLWDSYRHRSCRHLGSRDIVKEMSPYRKIKYYVNLNKCGRKQAQDSKINIVDFVGLLTSVGESLVDDDIDISRELDEIEAEEQAQGEEFEARTKVYRRKREMWLETTRRSLRHFNAIYGLLMERPGFWSACHPHPTSVSPESVVVGSRKRKRTP